MTVGIDEVGRGSWAGPLVAGAVVLHKPINGLRDSKQLSRLERERLDTEIRALAVAIGLGEASPQEIDSLGMTKAITLAMERALAEIQARYTEVVIDGNYNFLRYNPVARCLTKADLSIASVSAASIIAKVARDRFMREIAPDFPGYDFEGHVGYGTRAHRLALKNLGITELHRRSFKPIMELMS